MAVNLFQKVGGTRAVTALIDKLYGKILTNPLTSVQFANKDVEKVKKYQVEFFSSAMGSGQSYTGKDMVAVHTGLKITDEQFNAVAQMLHDSMKELNLESEDIASVMTLAAGLKGSVVNL